MTTYSVKSLAQSDVKEEVHCEESDPISNFWDRFTSSATTLFDGTPFGGTAKMTGTAAKRGTYLSCHINYCEVNLKSYLSVHC